MKRGMQWQWVAGALVCAVFLSLVGAPGVFAWREKTQEQRRLKRDNATERRIALVIGNGAYQYARRLPNPANDARAMAQALREAGFEVLGPGGSGYVDLDLRAMLEAITGLGATLQKSGGVGLLYFAGHGVQANETNYLIPVDADPDDETKLKYQALDLKDALNEFVGNQLNIVILDACRDNPFKRSFQRTRGGGGDGLRAVEAPSGTLIAYSTAPGKTASDGSGANGLYTQELLTAMRTKGLPVEQVFKRVRVAVEERSRGAQTPWENSSLKGDFYFVEDEVPAPTVTREIPRGKLVVTAGAAGMEIVVDGKSQGRSEAKGEKFRLDGLVAGRSVEVIGRMKGREPAVKRVTVEANWETQVELQIELPASVTNAAGMEFVLVPGGKFLMGSTEADEKRWKDFLSKYKLDPGMGDERPAREVTIGSPFYMGKYEVTQEQWRYAAEKLPKVKRELNADPSFFKGENLPVENVSWEGCEEFVLRLNRLNDGNEYGLPTEAEWEYACRGGKMGDYAGELDTLGWYADNSGTKRGDSYQAYMDSGYDYGKYYEVFLKPNNCQTHPVGRKRANGFGLYDMHGNVWEWCQDRYHENYNGAPSDGRAWEQGSDNKCVLRGGSWYDCADFCRAADRYRFAPTGRYGLVGVRVAVRPATN